MAYVTERRGVYYTVIYEGRNPVTGRERRRWHRCEHHADAQRLARQLGTQQARNTAGSSTTLGDYLLGRWLPAKEATLAPSTPRHCTRSTTTCSPTSATLHCGGYVMSTSGRSIAGSSSQEATTVDRWQRRRSTTSINLSVPRYRDTVNKTGSYR